MSFFKPAKELKPDSYFKYSRIFLAGNNSIFAAIATAKELGKKIAIIDTSGGDSCRFAHLVDFDILLLESLEKDYLLDLLQEVDDKLYDTLIFHSLPNLAKYPFLMDALLERECHLICTSKDYFYNLF